MLSAITSQMALLLIFEYSLLRRQWAFLCIMWYEKAIATNNSQVKQWDLQGKFSFAQHTGNCELKIMFLPCSIQQKENFSLNMN